MACRSSMCAPCCARAASTTCSGGKAAWRLVFPLHVGAIPNADEHAIEGTPLDRASRPRVEPDDLIVQTKKRLSVFYPTDLDFLLRNLGVRTVVLNGGFTDCCVLNAAFDASNLDYRVVVLRDLVRGTNAEMEDAALKMVSLHLGLVMDSADLLAEWQAEDAPRSGGRAVAAAPTPRRLEESHDADGRPVAHHERPHARLGRLRRQQDVLRAEPADASASSRSGSTPRCTSAPTSTAPCTRPTAAATWRPTRSSTWSARARSSTSRSTMDDWAVITPDDARQRQGRDRAGRHPDHPHRLAPLLRGPAAAGPGALLLHASGRRHGAAALDAGHGDQVVRHRLRLGRPPDEHHDPPHAPATSPASSRSRSACRCDEFFPRYEYTHKLSGRRVSNDLFPFHNLRLPGRPACTPRTSAATSRRC